MKNNMEGNDVLQTVINTCNRYGIDWMQCPSYKKLTQSDINRSRLRKDARFRTEVAEEIRLWANQWSLKETGEELFPKSFVSTTKQQAQYDNGWKNIAGKLSESKLRKIVAESVRSCDDFYNYVIKRFNEEGIEVGDTGDAEELYQGCSNYDYETVPFEQLYQEVKNDWLSYKSEQKQYHGINENAIRKIVAESVKKVLKETEGYRYMIVTYNGEEEVNREYITLPRPDMRAYDNDLPFSLGSNQALIPID